MDNGWRERDVLREKRHGIELLYRERYFLSPRRRSLPVISAPLAPPGAIRSGRGVEPRRSARHARASILSTLPQTGIHPLPHPPPLGCDSQTLWRLFRQGQGEARCRQPSDPPLPALRWPFQGLLLERSAVRAMLLRVLQGTTSQSRSRMAVATPGKGTGPMTTRLVRVQVGKRAADFRPIPQTPPRSAVASAPPRELCLHHLPLRWCANCPSKQGPRP